MTTGEAPRAGSERSVPLPKSPRPRLLFHARAGRAALVVMALALILVTGCDERDSGDQVTPAADAAGSAKREGGTALGGFEGAIIAVVEKARPSAVQITSQRSTRPGPGAGQQLVPAGVGSGVVIDDQGHVLTNAHVVSGADGLTVTLTDGRRFPARLVGQDAQTDLAVLKIDGDQIPVAAIGRSSELDEGMWVVAIGNALGLEGGPTVTTGVVSALGRTVREPGEGGGPGPFLFDVIQTDAPINPGNSGGPLLNLDGEVIGINTLVAGSSGTGVPAQGIGFAIAIDTAIPLAREMIETGRVAHPYIGVSFVPLNVALASQFGTGVTKGVLVLGVEPGSPAARGGLREGDVIVALNGDDLVGESDLPAALNRMDAGDRVTLDVRRGGQTVKVTFELGVAPQR